jgi:hypothetical protein
VPFLIAAGAGVVSIMACLYARHLKIDARRT